MQPCDLASIAESRRWKTSMPSWARGEPLTDQKWLLEVPGRRGRLGVWGENLIFVSVTTGPARSEIRELAAKGIVTIRQAGCRELNATFHPDAVALVAFVVRPKQRRTISEAERARLAEMGAGTRFVPAVDTA